LISKVLEVLPNTPIEAEKGLQGLSPNKQLSYLRDYQEDLCNALALRSHATIESPTSSGKTVITTELCLRAQSLKILVTVPGTDLLHQTAEALSQFTGEKIGIYGDGKKETNNRITVATIQSISNGIKLDMKSRRALVPDKLKDREDFLKLIDYWIVDECHGSAAESYQIASSMMSNTQYRHGLTATLRREDGYELVMEGVLGPCVMKLTPMELIDKGVLCRPRVELHYFPHKAYDRTLQFPEVYKTAVVDNVDRTAYIAKRAKQCLAQNKGPVLILFDLLDHGELLHNAVSALGRTAYVSGATNAKDRRSLVQQIEDGEIDVVVASIVWVTGVNIKRLKTLIVAGSGRSGTMTVQRAGRVLRTHPDKEEALIIDICDEEPRFLKEQYIARRFFYHDKYPDHVYDVRMGDEEWTEEF
jgi:DNA repair protein RadD